MFRKKKKEVRDEGIISELEIPTSGNDWLADSSAAEGQLSVDMYQTENEVVVRAPIAGVKPDDVEVSVEDGTLTIRGSRADASEIKQEDYYMKECFWGAFTRSVTLPAEVDASKIAAEMKDGILIVRLPKVSPLAGKPIKIKPTSK